MVNPKLFLFPFLDALARFRNVTATLVMFCLFARPPAQMQQLDFHLTARRTVIKRGILSSFKSIEKIQVSLKSDKNNGNFT